MAGRTRQASANMDLDPSQLSPDGKILLASMQSYFQSEFSKFKDEISQRFEANQREITTLKQRVASLESQLSKVNDNTDWADQYERKDMVILSGRAVQDSNVSDVNPLIQNLLKTHLKIDINPTDINTAHYLAPLRRNSADGGSPAGPPKRNIVVKFVRRDIKKLVIKASRENRRNAAVYANESLTPVRRKIFYALRSMRKSEPSLVKGCTTQDGRIYAYTKPVANSQRDQKHLISNMAELSEFCRKFVKKDIDDFLNNFS